MNRPCVFQITHPDRFSLGVSRVSPSHLPRAFLFVIFSLFTPVILQATTVSPPSFPDLVNQSDFIVRAVVKSVTSDFAKPGSRKIITKVEMEVREIIAGNPPNPLVLRILGGRVGTEEMIVAGVPQFQVGDEGVYFVQGNGRQIFPLVAMMHGVYPIKRDEAGREYIARSNQVPLQDTSEVALPMTDGSAAELQRRMHRTVDALTPSGFAQQIRAAVKPSNTRLHAR